MILEQFELSHKAQDVDDLLGRSSIAYDRTTNIDNTSDMDKPVSTKQQKALDNIEYIANNANSNANTAQQTADKANIANDALRKDIRIERAAIWRGIVTSPSPLTIPDTAENSDFTALRVCGVSGQTGMPSPANPQPLNIGVTPSAVTVGQQSYPLSLSFPLQGVSGIWRDSLDIVTGAVTVRTEYASDISVQSWEYDPFYDAYRITGGIAARIQPNTPVLCSHMNYSSIPVTEGNGLFWAGGKLYFKFVPINHMDWPSFLYEESFMARAVHLIFAVAASTWQYQAAVPSIPQPTPTAAITVNGGAALEVEYSRTLNGIDDRFGNALHGTATGNPITLDDVSPEGTLTRAVIAGATTQATVPTIDNPIPFNGLHPRRISVSDGQGIPRIHSLPLTTQLYGGGGVTDEYDAATGNITHRWLVKVFTGAENWIVGSTAEGWNTQFPDIFHAYTTYASYWKLGQRNAICTHLPFVYENITDKLGNELAYCFTGNSSLYFFIKRNRLPSYDVAGLKAFVKSKYDAGTPISLVYERTTPTEEKVSPVSIKPYAPSCTITADSGTMAIRYKRDNNIVIGRLEAAFATLK